MSNTESQSDSIQQPVKSKHKMGWLFIIAIFLIALFTVAAIKNPSEADARNLIKEQVTNEINNRIQDKLSEDDSAGTYIAAALGRLFLPTLLDITTDIEVNDYVIFSTFTVSVEVSEEESKYVKGIIVFGKVIGTSSNFNSN